LELLHGEKTNFLLDLYMSGTNFFTLGLGDVTPQSTVSRLLTVIEAGMGFGFLAAIISYLPVLYQAFSRRELSISLLDAPARDPAAGRARRLAAPRRDAVSPPRRRFACLRASAGRMGALGGRAHGEPSLLSDARLLPLAASEPVVARRPHHHPRHECFHHGDLRRLGRAPGAAHLRHGAPCRGRSLADLPPQARRRPARPVTLRSARPQLRA